MVSVSGNVSDELLGGEGEEAREWKRGGRGREPGESEVVLRYGIRDLAARLVSLGVSRSYRKNQMGLKERIGGGGIRLERSRPFWRESLEGKYPFGRERGVQAGVRPTDHRAEGQDQ